MILLWRLGVASVAKVRHNMFPEVEEPRNSGTGPKKNVANKVDRPRG